MRSVVPEGISNARSILHFSLELVYLLVVVLQGLTDGVLEVVNLHKVWEEWQHVLNLDYAP